MSERTWSLPSAARIAANSGVIIRRRLGYSPDAKTPRAVPVGGWITHLAGSVNGPAWCQSVIEIAARSASPRFEIHDLEAGAGGSVHRQA